MLRVKTHGNESKPLLIFFHGFMGDSEDFSPIIDALSNAFFCVSFDLPGHGQSKTIPFNSREEFLKLIRESLEPYLEMNPILVGYSFGGRIIQHLLPSLNLKSSVLISSTITPPLDPKARLQIDNERALEIERNFYPTFLEKWYSASLFCTLKKRENLYTQMIQKRKNECPKSLAHILRLFSPALFSSELDSDHSFLYLAGEKDKKYKAIADEIPKRYPKATVKLCAGASHALHIEDPRFVACAIKNYMRIHHD